LGVENSAELTFIDVGSLHALELLPGRSVYAASKAMGLDLCISMHRGGEIKRILYVTPGPIDTHMLHRNYWVSKEHGPVAFFEQIRNRFPGLYRNIFVHCQDDAFAEAARSSDLGYEDLKTVFGRYKERRLRQIETPNGVLDPEELARRLVSVAVDEKCYPSGAYVFTAPRGQLRIERLDFEELVRKKNC
jgi:NAD(P)-dependent dehydrogenase (short-subunit alcohol dehydrogenase family)